MLQQVYITQSLSSEEGACSRLLWKPSASHNMIRWVLRRVIPEGRLLATARLARLSRDTSCIRPISSVTHWIVPIKGTFSIAGIWQPRHAKHPMVMIDKSRNHQWLCLRLHVKRRRRFWCSSFTVKKLNFPTELGWWDNLEARVNALAGEM